MHKWVQYEVRLSKWAGYQIKEKYQNGCHLKIGPHGPWQDNISKKSTKMAAI